MVIATSQPSGNYQTTQPMVFLLGLSDYGWRKCKRQKNMEKSSSKQAGWSKAGVYSQSLDEHNSETKAIKNSALWNLSIRDAPAPQQAN